MPYTTDIAVRYVSHNLCVTQTSHQCSGCEDFLLQEIDGLPLSSLAFASLHACNVCPLLISFYEHNSKRKLQTKAVDPTFTHPPGVHHAGWQCQEAALVQLRQHQPAALDCLLLLLTWKAPLAPPACTPQTDSACRCRGGAEQSSTHARGYLSHQLFAHSTSAAAACEG